MQNRISAPMLAAS